MEFSPSKVAFNRHESFALRFGWLTKGFQAFQEDPEVFTAPDSVVKLGVGKNMVNSIRHWLRASQLIEISPDKKVATEMGKAIFSKQTGWDPYLEDEATIWLIHWLIATNPIHATSWYWFFNRYHKPEFTSQEAGVGLVDFAKEHITGKFTVNSVKNDCTVLLRNYVQSKGNAKMLAEEALDSPLSLLKLISYTKSTKSYHSRLSRRDNLPLGIFGYALANIFKQRNIKDIPIEDLMYSQDGHIAPGLVFRLTENDLLTKIEQLVHYLPDVFKVTDSAGIHQLYLLQDIDPMRYLEKHYNVQQQEQAA